MPLSANQLYGQFLLRKSDEPAPDGWHSESLHGWTLAAHAMLPVRPIRCNGELIGWLLGFAAQPDGNLVSSALQLESLDDVEESLYRLGGRFAGAIVTPKLARLYLDPCGSLSAVYAVDQPAVGSTTTLLLLGSPEFLARKAAQPTPGPNQFFPAGLTGDPEFARLLPNHYLDLHAWRAVRHWPTQLPARGDESRAPDHIRTIVEHLQSNIAAVARDFNCYMGLTAGRDSRMVLACARDVIDRIRFVTFRYKPGGYNKEKVVDLHIAQKLSKKLSLRHQELPLRDPPQQLKDEFQFRTGYCGHWGRVVDHYDAVSSLDMNSVWLTGFAGEVGRAFYWGWGEDLKKSLDAPELLRRMHLPDSPENLAAMNRWLESLPGRDYFALLDLLYIEQRLGAWAGPAMYGAAPFAFTLTPFSHRGIFQAMMSLPHEYRMRQQLAPDVAHLAWPEAATLPFQKYTGLQSAGKKLREKLSRLRKRLSG